MKRICVCIALLFVSLKAFGQVFPVQGDSFQGGTQAITQGLKSTNYLDGIVPSATITVYLTGTLTLATIYKDSASTPLANPFTSNTVSSVNPGGWIFYAACTGYDVVASGGVFPNTYSLPVTLFKDISPSGCGAGGSGPLILTNSVPNTLQNLLNFTDTSTIAFTNPSGGIESATCKTATTSAIGCVRPDNSTITISGGVLTAVSAAGTITNFKSQGTLLGGAFQPVGGIQTWDYDPVAITADAGFVNATMKDNTGTGKLDFEVPISGTNFQMLVSGLPAGQSAILWPTQKPSCTASGGGTINTCTSHIGYSAGADGACGGTASVGGCSVDAKLQNFQYCPANGGACTPLPPGWSVANITAEYLVAIFGGTTFSAQVSLTCAHNGVPTGSQILSSGLQQFSHVYASVIDPATEVCDFLVNHNPGNDGRINSGSMPLIAMVAFDASDPAPPPTGALYVQAPLSYNAGNSTISLSAPINAAFDFGAVNAYQAVSAIEVNGPKIGDTINLITGTTNTGASTLAITNAVSNIAYSIVRRSGATTSAVVAGDLPSGVPIPLIFDGLDWDLYSVGAAAPTSSLQYNCSGLFCGDLHGSTDGAGNLTLNTITLGDNSPGVAAYIDLGAGTAPSAPPTNTVQIYGPASVTSYSLIAPSVAPTSGAGFLNCAGSATPFTCIWTSAGGGTVTGSGTTGYIPAWTTSTALGNSHCDDGVTTGSTLTCTEPLVINASSLPSQVSLTYDSHAPTVGGATTAVFAADSSGNGELSSGGAAFSLICTQATGCPSSGSTAWSAITGGTNTNALLVGSAGTFGPSGTGVVTGNQEVIFVANASSTGTTANTLTKLTGAPSTAVIAATTDTGGIVGITIAGAGITGTATVARGGLISCVFSNGTTAGDYVQISSVTGGDCADTTSATYPTSGQVIGRVFSTNASAGTYQIDLFPSEIKAGGGGSGTVTTTGSPASGQLAKFSGATSITTATAHDVANALVCADTSGSGTVQSCNTSPTYTPAAGDWIIYTTTTANTGTGLTLNVNSLGAKSVAKWQGTTTLAANDVLANKYVLATYDGTNWELSTIGNAPSGGSGAVTNITSSITWTGCTVSSGVCSPGSAVASLTAASIPQTYNAIRVVVRGHSSGSNDTGVIAQFNSDTTAGDYTCAFGGYSAGNLLTTCAAVSINFAYVTCISISGDSMGGGSFDITGYASVTKQTTTGTCARQYSAGLSSFLVTNFWQPASAAAISTIKLFLTGGDNFSTDVTVSVYGIS